MRIEPRASPGSLVPKAAARPDAPSLLQTPGEDTLKQRKRQHNLLRPTGRRRADLQRHAPGPTCAPTSRALPPLAPAPPPPGRGALRALGTFSESGSGRRGGVPERRAGGAGQRPPASGSPRRAPRQDAGAPHVPTAYGGAALSLRSSGLRRPLQVTSALATAAPPRRLLTGGAGGGEAAAAEAAAAGAEAAETAEAAAYRLTCTARGPPRGRARGRGLRTPSRAGRAR